MKKRIFSFILLSLFLTGCGSWMNGEYASVTPHTDRNASEERVITPVTNYSDIRTALENMVRSGIENGALSAKGYEGDHLGTNMDQAIQYITGTFPLGIYAVENIVYVEGTLWGAPAIVFSINYNQNRSVLPRVRQISDMATAEMLLTTALNQCDSTLVMYIENYEDTNFQKIAQDYALAYPDLVMEVPQIAQAHYPQSGAGRVVELQFNYQNSRETLLTMQGYVAPVFSSATLYVSGESNERTKYEMLYTFLMTRNTYKVEASATPAYSLLRHGVGDSKAFASVYADMCRLADLDCQIVSGTRGGFPWTWNIVRENGRYYHVDLLYCYALNQFMLRGDSQMAGYVWDRSAYPACTTVIEPEDKPDDPDLPGPDFTDPTEPIEPTTPSEPVEPTEPSEPTAPSEPSTPSEPVSPSEPTEPTTEPTEEPTEDPTEDTGGAL